jgi:hypothetical protein
MAKDAAQVINGYRINAGGRLWPTLDLSKRNFKDARQRAKPAFKRMSLSFGA